MSSYLTSICWDPVWNSGYSAGLEEPGANLHSAMETHMTLSLFHSASPTSESWCADKMEWQWRHLGGGIEAIAVHTLHTHTSKSPSQTGKESPPPHWTPGQT